MTILNFFKLTFFRNLGNMTFYSLALQPGALYACGKGD